MSTKESLELSLRLLRKHKIDQLNYIEKLEKEKLRSPSNETTKRQASELITEKDKEINETLEAIKLLESLKVKYV